MRLVGFGCSFTYGSELLDSTLEDSNHPDNYEYREKNVWLGRLAEDLNLKYDNRGEPANSNFAIAQQVSQYILNNSTDDEIIICVGWTARTRMSWFDDRWVHNGFASNENGWHASAKEWVINSNKESHIMYTENAKLIVNSICKANNIPILQFNALGTHETTNYPNYFIDGFSMDNMLRRAMKEDDRLNLIASGGHPNEAGHEYFTIRLTDFVKSHIIKQ
tara:strand:+ start:759 stop:1418 length:660 start_codon:yes stop_codon:yes gene_type:complete